MTCTHCRKQIVRARVVEGQYFCNERCTQMHVWSEYAAAVQANYEGPIIVGFDYAIVGGDMTDYIDYGGPDFFGPVDNIIERPIYYTGTASNPWPKEEP